MRERIIQKILVYKYQFKTVSFLLIYFIHQFRTGKEHNYNIAMYSWKDTLKLGKHYLKNRIILSAMTRVRCDLDGIPNDLLRDYYKQRTGAGLLLTQASAITNRGIGFPGQGCIFNKEQVNGWKKVLAAVHQRESIMYLQLFHAGRVSHPTFNGGLQSWAPSAIKTREKIASLNNQDYPIPKQMTQEDIQTVKKQYQNAFILAKQAGFDGIQFHASLGYLLDQFIRSFSNSRKDNYGGNAQNRSRLLVQLVDIALKYFQPYQIGVKLSPTSRIHDMFDENPVQTYQILIEKLNEKEIGFIELTESVNEQTALGAKFGHKSPKTQIQNVCKTFRPYFNGIIVANYGMTPSSGLKKIQDGQCDAVSFGKPYISHPDLAERIQNNLPLSNRLDLKTLYWDRVRPRELGYTDYPFYQK